MSDQIEIADVAVASIWAQAVPEMLDRDLGGPTAALARRPRYEQIFGGSEGPVLADARFGYPWPYTHGAHFWEHYVGTLLDSGDGAGAWRKLLPLRERLQLVSAAEPVRNWRAESFYYPHGLALVVNLRWQVKGTLVDTVNNIQEQLSDAELVLTIDGERLAGRLPALAARAFRTLATSRIGRAGAVNWQADRFTVTTIIQSTEQDPTSELEASSELRRALAGLATQSPTWRNDGLGPLEDVAIRRSKKPPGHVLYLAERGRAVYFPSFFAQTARKRHSLTCYHRNLVFASLTTEALTEVLREIERRISHGRGLLDLSVDQRELATNAFDRLVELHQGAKGTYRTRSATHQLAANGGRDLINRLAPTLHRAALP